MVRETRHLWVGNLPETVREDRIREHFKRYGRVQSVKILLDKHQRLHHQQDGGGIAGTGSSPNVQSSTATNSTIDYGGGAAAATAAEESRCGALNRASSVNSNSSSGDSCQTTAATAGGGGGSLGGSSTPNSSKTNCSSRGGAAAAADPEATTTVNSSTVIGSSNNNNSSSLNNHSSCPTGTTTNSNHVSRSISSSNLLLPATTPPAGGGGNGLLLSSSSSAGSVCATVAFMDIKSASKAHTAEHKFDDRILTTEYYEPSTLAYAGTVVVAASAVTSPSSTSSASSSSSCSSSSVSHQQPMDGVATTTANPIAATTTSSTNAASSAAAATCLGVNSSSPSSQHHPPLQQSTSLVAEGRAVGSSSGGVSQSQSNHLASSSTTTTTNNPTLGSAAPSTPLQQQKQYSAVGPSSLATRFPSSNNNNNNNMNSVSVHNSSSSNSSSSSSNLNNHVVPSSSSSSSSSSTTTNTIATSNTLSMPLTAAAAAAGPVGASDVRSPKEDSPYFDRGVAAAAGEHYNSNNINAVGGGGRRHLVNYHGNSPSVGNGGSGVQGGRRDRLYNRNGSYSNSVVDRSNSLNMHTNSHSGGNISSGVGHPPRPTSTTGDHMHGSGDVRRSLDHMERRMSESSDGGGANHHLHSVHHHNSNASSSHGQGGGGMAVVKSAVGGVFSTNNNNSSSGPRRSRSKLRSGSETPPPLLEHHHGNHHHHSGVAAAAAAGTTATTSTPGGGGVLLGRDSRSHSRSPSSCSSSNSTSSNGSARSPSLAKLHSEYNHHHHHQQHHLHQDGSGGAGVGLGSGHMPGARSSRVSSSGGNSSDQAGPSGGSVGTGSSGGGTHTDDNKPLAICVRNLPIRSSDTSLKDGLFHEYKKHGKVTSVKVVGQNADRYALVCFKKRDDVEKALEVSRNKLFFGSKIEVVPYVGYDVEDNEFRPYEAELDENHPKATRTLFIGNLEKDISNSELWKHFESFGEIIEIDIKKQGTSAYAFCQYSDIVSVVKAMRKMDGEHLGINRIKLGFGKSMPTNCVWLDGIAETVSETHLIAQFNRFGHVSQVCIDPDRHLALVFFEQIQSAQLAVKDMRGFTLRGKKLQIDFASRECQDAFFEKLEKAGHGDRNPNGAVNRAERATFENRSGGGGGSSGGGGGTGGGNFNRNYDNPSRSRTSSFSRHPGGNASGGNSGATSPISTSERIPVAGGGTTPRGAGRPRTSRYLSNAEYYGDSGSEMPERRNMRSYDEYSQGSAASHDDLYESPAIGPATAPVSTTEQFNYPTMRSSRLGSVGGESPPPPIGRGATAMDVDITSASALAANQRRRTEKSPAELRHLHKERVHLLEQLEGCPSSGDEVISPKKRLRYDPSMALGESGLVASNQPMNSNDLICDPEALGPAGGFREHGSSLHRKVEVRRLSESSQKLLLAASNNLIGANNLAALNRRPSMDKHHALSTESGFHSTTGYQPSSVSKRRRTGDSNCSSGGGQVPPGGNDLHAVARGSIRGGGLSAHNHHHHHPAQHHSHNQAHAPQTSNETAAAASGGESPEGSRPGTPLCDEWPETLQPAEPRPLPRDRPHEPMVLPLPKWAIQYYQQHRMLKAMEMHSGNALNVTSTLPTALLSLSAATAQPMSQLATLALREREAAAAAGVTSSPASVRSSSPKFGSSTFQHLSRHNESSSGGLSSMGISGSCFVPPSPMSGDPNVEPVSPHRPMSSSSNGGSDSEMSSANASPSFAERIKMLDEMLEKVNGCSSRSTGTAPTTPHIGSLSSVSDFSRSKDPPSLSALESPSFRSRFDVKVVAPSDILKSVLAKKSIFDEDSKRLENIGDKYEPSDYQNLIRHSPQIVSTAAATTFMPMSSPLGNLTPATPTTPNVSTRPTLPGLALQPNPRLAQVQHVATPLQSPQPSSAGSTTVTASSLNSPMGPVTPGGGCGSGSSSSGLLTPVKGLQYPFPSHPPAPVTQPPPMPPLPPLPPAGSSLTGKVVESTGSSSQPPLPPAALQKAPAMVKSASMNESTPTKTISSAASSKLLAKSLSLPTTGSTAEERHLVTKKPDQTTDQPTVVVNEEEATTTSSGHHHKREYSKHSSGSKSSESKSAKQSTSQPAGVVKSKSTEEKNKTSSHNHKKEETTARKHSERSAESKGHAEENHHEGEERSRKIKHDKENISDQNKVPATATTSSKHNESVLAGMVKREESGSKPMDALLAGHKIKEEIISVEEAQPEDKRKHGESRNVSPTRSLHTKRRLDSTDSTEADEKRSKLHAEMANKSSSSSSKSSAKDKERERDSSHGHKSSHKSSAASGSSSSKHQSKLHGHGGIAKSASLSEEVKPEEAAGDNRIRSMSVDDKGHEAEKRDKAAAVGHKKPSSYPEVKRNSHKASSMEPQVLEDTNAYDRDFIDRMEEQQNMKIRSSDEEQQMHMQKMRLKKEKKREKYRRQLAEEERQQQQEQQQRDGKSASPRNFNRTEEGGKSSSSSENERPRKSSCNLSTDSDDSDGPRKHSIFDIPEEVGPSYISMYDKVKARSCKNKEKQQEVKTIKAKFSQLKKSRRRGKKWFGSDSEGYNSSSDVDTSDEEGQRKHHHKADLSDMDSDERARYRQQQIRALCDGDSSDSSTTAMSKSRQKIMSRKNSRSTRIESDSSDDGAPLMRKTPEKVGHAQEGETVAPAASVVVKLSDKLEAVAAAEDKPKNQMPPQLSATERALLDRLKDSNGADEIPEEIKRRFQWWPFFLCDSEAKRNHQRTANHQKRKKRGKSVADEDEKEREATVKTPSTAGSAPGDLFDELKKDPLAKGGALSGSERSGSGSCKKKHSSSRKDKRRERPEREQPKDDKSKAKREKKRSTDQVPSSNDSEFGAMKREEKMEEIFGPLSDDDTNTSFTADSSSKGDTVLPSSTPQPTPAAIHPPPALVTVAPVVCVKQEPGHHKGATDPAAHAEKNSTGPVASSVPVVTSTPVVAAPSAVIKSEPREEHHKEQRHKEEARKMKKEKKRKERERSRSVISREDENSVDLDEAGRALEAQLMNELETKTPTKEEVVTLAAAAAVAVQVKQEVTRDVSQVRVVPPTKDQSDLFRLTDPGEESGETHHSRDKDGDQHRHAKEKKKKKKRSKEEKLQRREHSSSASVVVNAKPATDPSGAPSLPSLLEDSPTSSAETAKQQQLPVDAKHQQPLRPVKVEKFIPGFGVDLDREISESAVKSISAVLESKPAEAKTVAVKAEPREDEPLVLGGTKLDEKTSRALISQEETEDAVAALLGESFASSTDYSELYPPSTDFGEDASPPNVVGAAPIPDVDAEEMRKAVQSLNAEEMKPDTPQSEHDLQIDTDTEQDDSMETSKSSKDDSREQLQAAGTKKGQKKEGPIKTASSSVITKSPSAGRAKASPSAAKEQKKQELLVKPVETVVVANKPPEVVAENPQSTAKGKPEPPSRLVVNAPPTPGKPLASPQLNYSQQQPPTAGVQSGQMVQSPPPPAHPVVGKGVGATVSPQQAPGIPFMPQPHPQKVLIQAANPPPGPMAAAGPRPVVPYAVHPPTISIPEQYVVQHMIPSPRDPRMMSPRMHPQQQFVKASSPQSPNIRGHGPRQSPQLSPVMMPGQQQQQQGQLINQHLMMQQQQQRQMMSPTSPNQQHQQQQMMNTRPGMAPQSPQDQQTIVRMMQGAGPHQMIRPGMQSGSPQSPNTMVRMVQPKGIPTKTVIESLPINNQQQQQIQLNIPKSGNAAQLQQSPTAGGGVVILPKGEKESLITDNVSVIKSAAPVALDVAQEVKLETTVIKKAAIGGDSLPTENVKQTLNKSQENAQDGGEQHENDAHYHQQEHSATAEPSVSKRGRGRGTGRAKKVSVSETVPASPGKPVEMVDPVTGGVQTRRGGAAKTGPGRKNARGGGAAGRGGRGGGTAGAVATTVAANVVATPTLAAPQVPIPQMVIPQPPIQQQMAPANMPVLPMPTGHVPTAAERKARSQNPDSDVYEFHDDSGEDVSAGGRPRVILSAPVVKPTELYIPQPNGRRLVVTVPKSPESMNLATLQSMPQLQSPPAPGISVAGDDFTTPSSTNTRKSRRLQERDGTRTTVDDIIEDVVKNVPNSPKSSSGQTPPRRNTRSASSGSSKGDGTGSSEVDAKRSPRASRKPRKNSEHSAESGDEMMMMTAEEQQQQQVKQQQQSVLMDGGLGGEPKMLNLAGLHQQIGTPLKTGATSVVTSVVKTLPMDLGGGAHKGLLMGEEVVVVGKDKVNVQYMAQQQKQLPHGGPPQQIIAGTKVSTITPIISQAQPVITSSAPVGMQITVPTIATATQQPMRGHPLKAHVLGGQNRGPVHQLMVNAEEYAAVQQQQQQQQMHSPSIVLSKQMPPNAQQQQQMAMGVNKGGRDQSPHGNVVVTTATGKLGEQQPQNLVVKVHGAHGGELTSSASQPLTIHATGGKGPQQQQQHATVHPHGIPGQPQLIMQGNKIIAHAGPAGLAGYQAAAMQQPVTVANIVKVPQPPSGSAGHVIQIPQPPQQVVTATKGPIPQPLNIPTAKVEYITTTAAGGQQITKVQVPIQMQQQTSVVGQQGPKGQVQMGHSMQQQQQQQIQVIQQQALIQQQAMAKHHLQQQQVHQGAGQVGQQQQQQQQPHMLPANKGLHQAPQILTGAVASPPLKQPHLSSQQPIVTGASSSRVSIPHISPQGPSRHMLQAGLPVSAFEANVHGGGELAGFGLTRSQSPPPAHQQQISPITPGDFRMSREQYLAYQTYMKAQQEALSLGGARYPSYHKSRSPLLPGAIDQNQPEQLDDAMGANAAPLELRRVTHTPNARNSTIPQSLQSPGDRATDSPQVAQVYVPGTRFPHPHYPEAGARYYDNPRASLGGAEPPPAHRPANLAAAGAASAQNHLGMVAPAGLPHIYAPYQKQPVDVAQQQQQQQQREREQQVQHREREQPRTLQNPGHSTMTSHGTMVPALPGPSIGRSLQVATPPHASQVPPQADSLQMLLQRYPVMWQGLLALKNDSAAVQMHFVFGNAKVADDSLPRNVDGPIPLRIAQRMRLEQTQLEGVARKMQTENEHCMLLALPCGRDHMDVLQQSTNLQSGFITYMQQKQAAGIVNIAAPGTQQPAFVVHIFPSCEFANENLARIAPDLLHRVADIAHLLIVIATV